MKQVRKAVRTFLINDNKVIVIKYKTNKNMNYYDIPGGKIEENCSMWINIEDLLNENKKFPSVEIIKHLDGNNINLKIYSDDDHNILNIEY